MKRGFNELLDVWAVHPPGMWKNELSSSPIGNWYAVSDDSGIVAYFHDENDAYRYRLDQINRELNG